MRMQILVRHHALLPLHYYHYYGTTTMKPTITTGITFEVLGEADGVVARVGAAAGLDVLAHELAHLFVVRVGVSVRLALTLSS